MTKIEQIYELLLRPEGCTQKEAAAVVGWKSVSLPNMILRGKLRLRKVDKSSGQFRYYAVKPESLNFKISPRANKEETDDMLDTPTRPQKGWQEPACERPDKLSLRDLVEAQRKIIALQEQRIADLERR